MGFQDLRHYYNDYHCSAGKYRSKTVVASLQETIF